MKTNTLRIGMMVAAVAALSVGTVSCRKGCTNPQAINYDSKAKKDDGSCEVVENTNIVKSGFITSDETWTSDNVYELDGKVIVNAGVTLTIEPGTIIKGQEGTGTLASALIVARGGMINAEGTASQPIIFTSVLDEIQVGQTVGSNLEETDQGKWGGVIILGYAPISAADGDTETQIEGIPPTDTYGAYGGSNAADNSGIFSYVSIRHGGALIGEGNEINGLTLGGVGNGTTISNIEIVGNVDDGVEFFGGTVNATNILVGFQGDDGIDIDMNYSGTIENFQVVCGATSDEALEVDGPEGATYMNGMFTLTNGTTYTYGGSGASSDFKSKAQGTVNNVIFGTTQIRASYQNDCADPKTDAFTHLTDASPKLVFTGTQYDNVSVWTGSKNDAGTVSCSVPGVDQTTAENAISSSSATGATNNWSWTWMSQKGKL